jgi:uncharacterized phage protein gp47/JayE|nr:MAG TPA: Baseplate J like protein [Caudoviricetes sp.]
MFESYSYEKILSDMFRNVPNDIDKREGSIIFDALSPIALELANVFVCLDIVLNNAYADTAERDYLVRLASERGISPKSATNAILKGVFDAEVQIGSKFSLGDLTYTAIEQIDDTYVYKMQCNTAGTIGNSQLGTLLPYDDILNLTTAELTEILVYGEDAEDTESFRDRFFELINNPAYQGNKAQYKQWVKDIDGVGQCKVVRTPDGGGTVGIIFTSSEDGEPSVELVKNVKKTLDPTETEGQGDGLAPVGHVVYVAGVDLKGVTINIDWLLANGADEATVTVQANEIIKDYIKEINAKWEDNTALTLSSYQLIARLAEITEIQDIASLTFGDNTTRILEAKEDEIFNFETLVIKGA